MIRLAFVVAAFLFSAPASAGDVPSAVGTAEDLRLMDDYSDCTFAAARRLKDIDPSATIVAQAAHDTCASEWQAWKDNWHASDDRHDAIESIFESYKAGYMAGLIVMVEQFRAGR